MSKYRLRIQIDPELNSRLNALTAGLDRSAWISEAIRSHMDALSDLPLSAQGRIAAYVALVRAAVRDEELAALERAWAETEDPGYYGAQGAIPSTLDASIDLLVGRGASRRVRPAPRCV